MNQRKVLIALASISVILIFSVLTIAKSQFTYSEIDLNGNGVLGVSEIMYFAEYGTREIEQGGKLCTEYYALKDGLSLKVRCSEL